MRETPTVSIIVPSYNHRAFIGLLIDSILSQTFKDFELIVLDDGSTDGSPEYLKDLQAKNNFRLVIKENEGLCATLNKGLELSKGKYIIPIGSDDLFVPTRLEEQVRFMDSSPETDVVAGSAYLIDGEGRLCGKRVPALKGSVTFSDMVVINRVLAPTVMIRKDVFSRLGPYPKDYLFEDYYLWMKILSQGGKIHNTDNFWAYYRVSNTNLEKKFSWYYKGATQVLMDYQSHPSVPFHLRKNHFVYCIKLSLLLGWEFQKRYTDVLNRVSFPERLVLACLSSLPLWIRDRILIFLKLKV